MKRHRNNSSRPTNTYSSRVIGTVDVKASEPTTPRAGDWSLRKANAKLRNAPITLFLNPEKEALNIAQPYPVINGNNTSIERNYGGTSNKNGNVIPRLVLSTQSCLINEFDSGKVEIDLAYQYLKMFPTKDKSVQPYNANNQQYGTAYKTGFSSVTGELWAATSFPESKVTTSMPILSDDNNNVAAMVHYQVVLQNLALVLSKFNQTTLLIQDLINMGWQREENILTELFNLFTKNIFVGKWLNLGKFIKDEYFDREWANKINALVNIPTRKSNSVRDPLITVCAVHQTPEVTITLKGASTPYFDSTKWLGTDWNYVKSSSNEGVYNLVANNASISFEELCKKLINLLDQETILKWARDNYNGEIPSNNIVSANQYINMLTKLLDSLISMMNTFRDAYSDLRVFMTTAQRVGLLKWTKGTEYSVFKPISKMTVSNNINVRDMIIATCATPSQISFNYQSYSWTFLTLWDEYEGIPQYDASSGGADITFSSKPIIDSSGILSTDITLALPILYKHRDTSKVVKILDRLGNVLEIATVGLTAAQIKSNIDLNRLIPFEGLLPGSGNVLNVPSISITETDASKVPAIHAAASRFLLNYFKIGLVSSVQDSETKVDTYISSSLICMVDGQMENEVAAMTNYIWAVTPLSTISGK